MTTIDQIKAAKTRQDYRMRLFVSVYVLSLHLNKVDAMVEARRALAAFDIEFPSGISKEANEH